MSVAPDSMRPTHDLDKMLERLLVAGIDVDVVRYDNGKVRSLSVNSLNEQQLALIACIGRECRL